MEKVNITEILKDCPKGMELDCAIFNDVTLYRIDTSSENEYPIRIETKNGNFLYLTKYGTYSNVEESKCVIFPKGKTTWEGFVPPCEFKDGDILISGLNSCEGNPFIFKQLNSFGNAECYCAINCYGELIFNSDDWTFIKGCRFATEEEKQKLFDAIKDNGYKWNSETKTFEKVIQPKFKVGDIIKHKTYISKGVVVTEIKDTHYILDDESALPFTFQDEYDLVPNKFDITTLVPFESKVLVRHNKDNKWCGSFFSHIDGNFHSHCYKYVTIAGKSYPMCIPYEKNEHLLGTTNDCDEFYKTW